MSRRRRSHSATGGRPLPPKMVLAEDFSRLVRGPARFRVPPFEPALAKPALLN